MNGRIVSVFRFVCPKLYVLGSTVLPKSCAYVDPSLIVFYTFLPNLSLEPAAPKSCKEVCRITMIFSENKEITNKTTRSSYSEHKLRHGPRDVSPCISLFRGCQLPTTFWLPTCRTCYVLSSSISSFLRGISPVHMENGKGIVRVLNSFLTSHKCVPPCILNS